MHSLAPAAPLPCPGTLEITEVRIRLQNARALKAFATITLNHCFVVRSLKIIDGNNGLFVAMPTRQKKDGAHQDVAHPINREYRDYMESVVFDAYFREVGGEEDRDE